MRDLVILSSDYVLQGFPFIKLTALCPFWRHLVKCVYNIETVELKNKIVCHVLNSIQ